MFDREKGQKITTPLKPPFPEVVCYAEGPDKIRCEKRKGHTDGVHCGRLLTAWYEPGFFMMLGEEVRTWTE
jgi:hypothetical protein